MMRHMSVRPSDEIGARLAKYRQLAGISARELAEQAGCGLSRGVIANIESGRKRDITVDQLIALASVLGIPPAMLALPADQPLRFVRVAGIEDDSSSRRTMRVWAAIEWFNGEMGKPEQSNSASVFAHALKRGIRAYVRDFVALQQTRSKESDLLLELEADLRRSEEELEQLGIDLTEYKIDE